MFGRVSACMFMLKENYLEYQKLKDTLSPDKRIELLEVLIQVAINDFFNS